MSPIAFSGALIDRADHVRGNADALASFINWKARLLQLDGLDPRIGVDGRLAWTSLAEAAPDSDLIFLGLERTDAGERGCFVEVPAQRHQDGEPYANPNLWAALSSLSADELAVYGAARALKDWHNRHGFCARCGHETRMAKGGWQRSCTQCGAEHFPRVDPVTIMLAEHDGKLLLGRQPRFPPRRFSALAGFVEPGESIEEAVARELFEEAGVRVRDVRYVISQPWPFPSSLMIACTSTALDDALTIDTTELDEARWFTREEVAAAMAGDDAAPFIAPPPFAVAHALLKWWLEQPA